MSDLMLLLSEKESFGLVALEAMACGVPVIATKIGGIPEVVEDEVTGYLCPLGNIEEAAAKAISLLADDKKRQAFKRAALKRVKQSFDSQHIVSQYERLYEAMLKGEPL
jgi:L-malate glycosyltransferase